MERHELVIIGAGPAGLSAAIYARRAGIETLVLEKGRPGGQILTTSRIENYPGLPEATGASLAEALRAHALSFAPRFMTGSVQKLSCCGDDKVIELKDGSRIAARAVIIASGAGFRRQGCPGEGKYTGLGVSYCAVCDAAFFEGLEVAVIGGGLTGCECALQLARTGHKVHLIEMRPELAPDANIRHRPILLAELEGEDIDVLTGAAAKCVDADGVTVTVDGEERVVPCQSVIAAIGQRSRSAVVDELRDGAPFVRVIGDAQRPANITLAIYEAYHAGLDV